MTSSKKERKRMFSLADKTITLKRKVDRFVKRVRTQSETLECWNRELPRGLSNGYLSKV